MTEQPLLPARRRGPLASAIGLARFTVTASIQGTRWGVETTARTIETVARAALSGTRPDQLADELLGPVRRALIGIEAAGEPVSVVIAEHIPEGARNGRLTLPEMFSALLDASADVEFDYHGHPAYFRLLNELAPDEARILRLFAHNGPQPAIDVRSKRVFGVGSQLLAPGITMIGAYAGLADKSRVPAYLNNLNRLGLIWFSREMLDDEEVYHLLEAQPEVLEAFKGVKVDVVMRSIELTAFGKNLCAQCGLLGAEALDARATLGEVTRALPPPDAR